MFIMRIRQFYKINDKAAPATVTGKEFAHVRMHTTIEAVTLTTTKSNRCPPLQTQMIIDCEAEKRAKIVLQTWKLQEKINSISRPPQL